ncbi:4058_t:CDS:1, partial [Ambispora gerdemannii]
MPIMVKLTTLIPGDPTWNFIITGSPDDMTDPKELNGSEFCIS